MKRIVIYCKRGHDDFLSEFIETDKVASKQFIKIPFLSCENIQSAS